MIDSSIHSRQWHGRLKWHFWQLCGHYPMIAATLGAWSVLCAFLAQVQFPHFLIICESVESIYGGLADDAVVYHVMQAMVGVVWAIGVLGLIMYVAIASRYRRASTRVSS